MNNVDPVRRYKDRFRIFLILLLFSDEFEDENYPHYKKLFTSEVKIQKIDFLLRNPDYLAYELLLFAKEGRVDLDEIKEIVEDIIREQEPVIRRLEMERFFFGAYEDIDDVISFLKSIDFIDFHSRKNSNLQTFEKKYYITEYALNQTRGKFKKSSSLQWYVNRCELIKKYFGDLSGTELKIRQYQIDEYRNTTYKKYIGDIQEEVKEQYYNLFKEKLV